MFDTTIKAIQKAGSWLAKAALFIGTKVVTEEYKLIKKGGTYYIVVTTKLLMMPVETVEFKVKDLAIEE